MAIPVAIERYGWSGTGHAAVADALCAARGGRRTAAADGRDAGAELALWLKTSGWAAVQRRRTVAGYLADLEAAPEQLAGLAADELYLELHAVCHQSADQKRQQPQPGASAAGRRKSVGAFALWAIPVATAGQP